MGDANDEELYKRQMMDEKLRVEEATRKQQEALAKLREEQEQARKAAEDAAKKGNMVADEPTVPNWPDNGYQATPPGRLDAMKGALGIGEPGDAAFVSRLLNEGRPPAAGAVADKAEAQTDGAKEHRGTAANTRGTAQAYGI
jgi:hypothetical protein